MRLLGAYLKEKKKLLGVYIIFGVVFLLTFALYQLPLQAVWYPFLICGFLGSIFCIVDFISFQQKHVSLQQLQNTTVNLIDELPIIHTLVEQDYQAVVKLLWDEQHALETEMNSKYTDMIQYYTVWAHQIKTPIASMRLSLQNTDTALSRKLSGELFRIEQYVEMVLMFLRLHAESTDYIIKEYPLDPLIKQAVKRFSSEFIEKKIRFLYEPISDQVITDEKWLSFVLEQILSNALKYTTSGTIRIYMTEQKVLCIEDSGMGIAPEDLPRIFENGYTGYMGRVDKKASGIGLYLCKTICDKLNHPISATSQVGVGTTIHIELSQYQLNTQ